jgi:hypothetical protein
MTCRNIIGNSVLKKFEVAVCAPWEEYKGVRVQLTWEINAYLHAPAALFPAKEHPQAVEWEAEPRWTLWRKEQYLHLPETEPRTR